MCIAALLEMKVIASEGALMLPPVVKDNIRLLGPVGQISRGVIRARRVTKSDNPIVWGVEAACLVLNMTGNVTTSKALCLAAALAVPGRFV